MDREKTMLELPMAHAVAIRLREAGASDHEIAVALAVPIESVATLLAAAWQALESLLGTHEPGRGDQAAAP